MQMGKLAEAREKGIFGMTETILVKLLEHNNWANLHIVEACSSLTDDQLDATPLPTSEWSIRHTLSHLVEAQRGYLSLLTRSRETRHQAPFSFTELRESAKESGEGLLALIRDEIRQDFRTRIQTSDGYLVEPWVVVVQTINHATEHRRQMCRMLRILDVTPPNLDGWSFGEFTDAVVPNPA